MASKVVPIVVPIVKRFRCDYYARPTNATANNKRALQQLPPLVCRRAPDEVISWPSSTAPRRYLPQTRGPPPPAPSNWRQALAADSV